MRGLNYRQLFAFCYVQSCSVCLSVTSTQELLFVYLLVYWTLHYKGLEALIYSSLLLCNEVFFQIL
jgi:hypothetical protein